MIEKDQGRRLRRYADTANFNVFIILSSRFHSGKGPPQACQLAHGRVYAKCIRKLSASIFTWHPLNTHLLNMPANPPTSSYIKLHQDY